jgi:hypothetical protein
MRIGKFSIAAVICTGMIATADIARAEVTTWPSGVPCSAITINPDGSYTLSTDVALVNGQTFASGTTFPAGGEYDVWAKCGS